MNTRDYLTKIHTYLQDHNTYKPLAHNPTSSIANDACTLMEYIHSQLIIARLLWNFYCLLRILPYCLSSMDFLKFTRQNALSTLLFLGLMVQMTISLPASPISANPQPAIFHHASKTQNIFSTLLKNFHPSHPIPSWSQLTSCPYRQTSYTKKAQQP